ncbi:MAG: hypothetical protein LKH74_11250 [Levilactobacillus sp.]|jgi:hypothetical protein|uniref:lectin-like domain-containing protein n=1 Tax=Levilactobacillus sp. TaxID=2767919 RepID=UPI00258D1E0C|nr:hypothetical protein [Levilactobacillus sp.]MCH4124228.1 hypothetical protein [Levilactobacillus sp.]MCI1554486.1 hypothetical protein [Levilactobacillus sp.]MCI1598328.1 hypothetical protein [Levilactobacillus sp.]MCI1605604.1 hypothetical protein [Levilactobacillus sp.]
MWKALLIGVLGLGIGWQLLASPVVVAKSSETSALKTTPQGIPIKAYFDTVQSEFSKATVEGSQNPTVKHTEVARLTTGSCQVGAIWSKPEQRFDLTQNQTVSMWLYFGNQGKDAAEGMAFVLQNDPRTTEAMTRFPGQHPKDIQGETLGVWGVDNHNQELSRKKTQQNVAQTAIQRSWALEFDTHLNTDYVYRGIKSANSFDLAGNQRPLVGPHLAANYPAEPSSYSPRLTYNVFKYHRYVYLKHEGLIQAGKGDYTFLANGQWHHVTLNYETESADSPTALMTYSFDDRNPITGISNRKGADATFKIDKSKIDPDKTGKAYWGFTGATGSEMADNLVVFDQVPGVVTGDATATLTDSKQRVIEEGDVVAQGEPLQLTYKLKYQQGRTNWQNILAQINLPEKVAFDTVTIHNADGSLDEVPATDWSANTKTFKHQLTSPLGPHNTWVTLTFTGKSLAQSGVVHPQISSFTSDEAAAESTTPEFNLGQPALSLVLDTPISGPIDNEHDYFLKGHVVFHEKPYPNTDLHIVSKQNGVTQYQSLSKKDAAGEFTYKIPANRLHTGKNSLELVVIAEDGVSSNPLLVTVEPQEKEETEAGQLAFGTLSEKLEFTGSLAGRSQELFGHKGFRLVVKDERPHGAWSLQAVAEPLIEQDTKKPLAGQLVYKSQFGDQPLNGADAQLIDEHDNEGKQTETNVAGDWQHNKKMDRGLFLRLASSAIAGNYQGKITWILTDAM